MRGPDEQAIALRGETGADTYESAYMPGEGKMLARHRMVAGRTYNTFMGALMALSVIPAVISGEFLAMAITAGVMAAMWVGLGVLRVSVSEGLVNVQYGTFGPTIPVHSIVKVEAIEYSALKDFGGWGIRRGRDGWMYNMMGDGGHAVRILWRDAEGTATVTYVGMRDAVEVAANIRKAMSLQAIEGEVDSRKALDAAAEGDPAPM